MISTTKVYRIRINRSGINYKFWYYNHTGEEFDVVMVSKQVSEGNQVPVFAIVELTDGVVKSPVIIRTVRPKDCTIVSEILLEGDLLKHFIQSF